MVMSTTALMPVEEYLHLTDKPYREYRDGVVSSKALPTKLHSIIQGVLMTLLQNQGVEAFPELTVRISPTKYLVPDVAVAGDFPDPIRPRLFCFVVKSCRRKIALGPCSASATNTMRGAYPSAGLSTPLSAPRGNITLRQSLRGSVERSTRANSL